MQRIEDKTPIYQNSGIRPFIGSQTGCALGSSDWHKSL